MAIRIPSKNIYSIQNERVLDNAIDGVSVEYNSVSPNNEFQKLVYVDTKDIIDFGYPPVKSQEDLQSITAPYTGTYTQIARAVAYVKVEPSYDAVTSYIPVSKENYYISTLLTGKKDDGNNNISYNIVGYKIDGTSNAKIDIGKDIPVANYKIYDLSRSDRVFGQKEKLTLPDTKEAFTQTATASGSVSQDVTASVLLDNESTISRATASIETIEGIDYYVINILYLSALRVTKLSGSVSLLSTDIDYTLELNGEYTEYYPTSIEISFYGNTIGISTEDKTITIGNENAETPLNVSGNELMQNESDISSKYNNTLEQYSFGKEIVHITCDIDDYYDYANHNKLKICANNPNVINTNNYVELWNATYDNGVVRQIVGETPFASGVADMNENIDEYGRYFQVYDKPMIPSLKINDSVTLNYKINGKSYSINTYIVDRYNGVLALSSQQGNSSYTTLVLLNENGYSIVAYVNINATQQTDGSFVNVGSSSQIIVQVLTAPSGTPNIEIEIPIVGYQFHLQAYETYPNIVSEYVKKVYYNGLVYFTFVKEDSFNYIRFKLNGEEIDTGISFDVSSLENGKTYSFLTNLNVEGGQGNISWNEMRIIKGVRYKQFVEQGLPMTFDIYDDVIPFVCVQDEYTNKLVDVPLSTNSDGTPKIFKVLANKFSSNGKVFQKLFLQEA